MEENILLGFWLRGEHLEDIKLLKGVNFLNQDVVDLIKAGKNLLEIGTETHRLAELAELTEYHSEILYKQAFAYFLEREIHHSIAEMDDLKEIQSKIETLNNLSLDTESEVKDPALLLAQDIQERANEKTYKYEKLPSLNNYTNGIHKSELTTVAARPSVGKSAFGLATALGVWQQGGKVLYFPLEMTSSQTFSRVLANKGYASARELRTGHISDDKKYMLGIDFVNEMYKSGRFKVYEGVNKLEIIEKIIEKEKPFLVVLDQLTQIRSSKSFNSIRERYNHITSTLKSIALREKVAIMLLCQINRNAQNQEPLISDLKESGSIEEDSDNVILLHNLSAEDVSKPEDIDWANERPMLLNLAKQRDGEIGKTVMMFKPSRFMFYERSKQ